MAELSTVNLVALRARPLYVLLTSHNGGEIQTKTIIILEAVKTRLYRPCKSEAILHAPNNGRLRKICILNLCGLPIATEVWSAPMLAYSSKGLLTDYAIASLLGSGVGLSQDGSSIARATASISCTADPLSTVAAGSAWDRSSSKCTRSAKDAMAGASVAGLCPELECGRRCVLSGSITHPRMHAGRDGAVQRTKREDEAAHEDGC